MQYALVALLSYLKGNLKPEFSTSFALHRFKVSSRHYLVMISHSDTFNCNTITAICTLYAAVFRLFPSKTFYRNINLK